MPPDDGADPPRTVTAGGAPAPGRWQIPFWAFQVLDLGVAFLLITQSVHVAHPGVLVAGGLLLVALALTADGPLGIVHLCGRRLHVVLVVVVALGMGAAAFVHSLGPGIEGDLVIAAAVVALVYLATRTAVSGGGRRGRRRRGTGPVIDATATVVPPTAPTTAPAGGPEAGDAAGDSVMRRAGRTTGAAAAAGKRTVDEHRPQVEDQVKRGLRGAGRLAGRLAGPRTPPAEPPTPTG